MLLDKMRIIVEQNISDADFNVASLADHMNMSRSTLMRKIKIITGKTPLQFIRDNLTKPFGVTEIAEALGITRIRINRLFTSELKRTVGEEILRQRIVKAKKLLVETDSTLEYIANECGFCHSSYFVNIFKRTTGLTPRRYRIQEQGKNTLRL
jgi:AraC-like DNA-binding protein